jgi:hypothetical protein
MTRQVDRKLQPVRVGVYRYRHEAELAGGILADAGIPYRLLVDDAGGADLGLTMLHPASLWVRAVDEEAARELIAWEEDDSDPVSAAPGEA